ncbi:uncharacterized protein LOC132194199 [Neocloeon triangulifer]|uniref:uncharacterized protein LOC132194199 n=1 Tax=Neocloeon triangulifer TaxID=2078957 RepID=UPI00286F50B9|nr:uncharacterized protein LOC132194199 [Neocloeon triangulifer]
MHFAVERLKIYPMENFFHFAVLLLATFTKFSKAADLATCANKIDCDVVRLQQYFCIARCISFVRDEAPSVLTNNGTCPAVNWWWRATTTTTAAPMTTTTVASGPCSSLKGFEKCCKTKPYDDLFPDDDSDCASDENFPRDEFRSLRKDPQLFSYLTASGDLNLANVPDSSYYFYDCIFKARKLIEEGEMANKKITSYLKKNADDSVADIIDEQVAECVKLTKKIPKYDEKIKIFANSSSTVRAYQSPYVFNLCIRMAVFSQCSLSTKNEDCRDIRENMKKCNIKLPKT